MFLKKYSSAVSFLIIIAAVYYSFYSLMPSVNTSKFVQTTNFDLTKALEHLKIIAEEPHYVGSPNHKKVQDYIVEKLNGLGLETQIQEQIAVNEKWRGATDTQNILARIKGADNSKALMLLTHYDSAPHSSLGASDAGTGVVTILEGLRAYLASGKQPKNDIIILISDAEEIGLLGASAFVNNHSWAKDVGLVLNFEARGSGGPGYMLMETNGGNKQLIEHFVKANPNYPVASSLMYSIYKMLPNDTDLTIFRKDSDIEGFNFAFIDDHFDYHTAQDSYERLDKNTLMHQASYLMPLLNYFADADLSNLKSKEDYVYFNFPFIGLVHYPFSWVIPMIILCTLLFIGLVIAATIKNKISYNNIFRGLLVFLKLLIVTGLVTFLGWKLILQLHPQYQDILHGFTYNGHTYIAAFITLTLGISFWIYAKHLEKIYAENLIVSPLFIWILINFAAAISLQGAAYFIVAVLYGLLAFSMILFSKRSTKSQQLFLTILSIPLLIIFSPMIAMFPIGLGLKMLIVSTIFTVLLFGLFTPIFSWYKNSKALGKLFVALSIIIFITASFSSNYNEERKKPNSINYVLDIDKNEAYWASYDAKPDVFTKQFLGDNPQKGSYSTDTTASKYNTAIKLHSKTEVKNIVASKVEINYDTLINDKRNISFTIIPQRKMNRLEVMAANNINFYELEINGIRLPKKDNNQYVLEATTGKNVVTYFITNPNENITLWISIPKDEKPNFTIYDVSYDLYENSMFKSISREKYMIPKPFVINDAIITKKQLLLGQKIP